MSGESSKSEISNDAAPLSSRRRVTLPSASQSSNDSNRPITLSAVLRGPQEHRRFDTAENRLRMRRSINGGRIQLSSVLQLALDILDEDLDSVTSSTRSRRNRSQRRDPVDDD